jgi:3-isopropylmalate dehydrogenase
VHRVACLAGDGIGPELMAEASRALRKVARMHGFAVEDVHAPIGTEALTRSGHPFPPATRSAVLGAEAVLVADAAEPALDGVAAQLDLRGRLAHVLCRRSDFVLLSPLDADAESWTVERAFAFARRRRGRLISVDHDAHWASVVDEEATRHDTVVVDHLSLADTVRALTFEPDRLDVVVTAGVVAAAFEELAAGDADDDRLVAVAQLAGNGPSVFAPAQPESADDAGHGVADPSSMLLAASLLLREGLGEEHAADTLAAALRNARRRDAVRRTLTATTRDFGDAVVSLLPASHRNAEFVPEYLPETAA